MNTLYFAKWFEKTTNNIDYCFGINQRSTTLAIYNLGMHLHAGFVQGFFPFHSPVPSCSLIVLNKSTYES